MYEFWYNYIKQNMEKKQNYPTQTRTALSCILKQKIFYKGIAPDVNKWFDTSGYVVDRPLPIGKNKKVLCKFKDELGRRIITEFVGVRTKTYSFLIDDFEEKKKNKGTKKCIVKRILKFNDYKDWLLNKKIVLKSQQRFKSEAHSVYTEEINKIALRSNDDKRVWSSDGITSYPYGYKGRFT